MFSNRISVQLTLFYSVATFILIAITALFFYFSLVNFLQDASRQFLADEIGIIQNIISTKPNNLLALKQEVTDIPEALHNSAYHYYIRILDNNGKIVTETPKMPELLKLSNDKNFLFIQSGTIQIALDVSYQKLVIKTYQRNVAIVILVGAFLSVLIGYLISQRGMRRLYELTNATKNITANALQQRIDPKFWPTELNELAEAYNNMLDRLEVSINRLTTFSDDLAHELRTPITNLLGEMEVALAKNYSADDYKRVLESNLEELNRLHQIVENLLFLARAENPQLELEKAPLNIHQEIDIVCQFYQAVADEKNIKLSCKGEAIAPVNSVMFRRMISNILSNALKHAPDGSNVNFVITQQGNHSVSIALSDSGAGIEKENLPKLFNRFYRTDSARTQDAGGTGLGLAIVKSIVDLHHGTVSMVSDVNIGSTITITLPK